jgi:hypothetical protein
MLMLLMVFLVALMAFAGGCNNLDRNTLEFQSTINKAFCEKMQTWTPEDFQKNAADIAWITRNNYQFIQNMADASNSREPTFRYSAMKPTSLPWLNIVYNIPPEDRNR